MSKPTLVNQVLYRSTRRTQVLGVLFAVLVLVALPLFSHTRIGTRVGLTPEQASAAPATTLNFQARLLSATGALVADGNYSIAFRLYNVASGGTHEWTETRTVAVKNGYFSIALADTTAGGTAFGGTINWQEEKWLTMNVNADGEMNPRIKLTAVPYAFDANKLDGIDSGGFAQLAPAAVQSVNATNAALRLNQTGTGEILQLQGNGNNVLQLSKTGTLTLGTASTNTGQVTFFHSGSAQSVRLRTGATTTGYDLILPLTAGNVGECLKNDGATPGLLVFTACGSSGITTSLQNAYDNGNIITTTNARNILFTLSNTATDANFLVDIATSSTSKFAVQSNGSDILRVTSASGTEVMGTLTVGTSTSMGNLVLNDGNGGQTTTIRAGNSSANLTYTLPTAYGSSGQCVKADDANGTLAFANCNNGSGAGGAVTLQNAYDASGTPATILTTSNTKDFILRAGVGFDSPSIFQVMNAAGNEIIRVNSSANQVIFGKASTVNGSTVWYNDNTANTVTLNSGATSASYSLTLPATGPATNQCLKTNATTASQLEFAACSTGGGVTSLNTLTGAVAINGTTNQVNVNAAGSTVTLSTPQDINTTSSVTFGGLTVNGSYLQTTSSTTAFVLQDATNNNALVFDSTNSELRIYENVNTPGNYARIYYESGAAVFAASTGETKVGSGTGDITLETTNGTDDIVLTSAGDIQLTSTSTIASGSMTLQGGGLTIGTSTQAGSLMLHDGNGGQTASINLGNLTANTTLTIPGTLGATDTFCFVTLNNCGGTAGVTSVNTFTGAITVQGTTNQVAVANNTGTLTLSLPQDINTTSNVSFGTINTNTFTATALTLSGANPVISAGTGGTSLTINANNSGDLNLATNAATKTINVGAVGTSANATTVNIANTTGNSTQTINIGSGRSSSVTNINAGGGGLNLGNSGIANTIQIGNTTGAVTQTVNIGTNATAASTSNLTLGSTIAGSTILQSAGGVSIRQALTLGTTTQAASLILHDGNGGQTATIGLGNIAANTALTLPAALGATDTFCFVTLANCSGTATTLEQSYLADADGSNAVINLTSADGGILFRDNASPLGATLFAVQNSGGTTSYLNVSATGVTVAGTLSVPGNDAESERFGAGATADIDGTAIGNSASAVCWGSVAVGNAAITGDCVAYSGNIAIGQSAVANRAGIALGRGSSALDYSMALGQLASAAGTNSIALGADATTTTSNQLVINNINDAYVGNGVTNAIPMYFKLNATGGLGTDIAGANLTFAGGRGTGSATGGSLLFQTAAAGLTGSTLNPLTTRMEIQPDGDTAIDTNTLFVDAVNDRVGVGIVSPATKLDVNGTTRTTNIQLNGGSGNFGAIGSNGTGDVIMSASGNGTGVFVTGSRSILVVNDDVAASSERLRLEAHTSQTSAILKITNANNTSTLSGFNSVGNLFYSNTGFTSTIETGVLGANRSLTIPGGSVNDTFCLVTLANCSGGGGSAGSGIAGALQFSAGSGAFNSDATNFFWDNTNKRLGIGTNAPANKLHIIESTTNTIGLNLDAAGGGSVLRVRDVNNISRNVNVGFSNTDFYINGANAGSGGFNIVGASSVLNLKTDNVSNAINLMPGNTNVMTLLGDGNIYVGNGATNAIPAGGILQATGGSGTNITGASLTFAGGRGTGTGVGGNIVFQYAPAGLTGSTANALQTACTISGTNGSLSCSNGSGNERFGNDSIANGSATLAVGWSASAGSNSEATAVGYAATASNNRTLAVGTSSSASGNQSTAIGVSATVSTQNSISLGWNSSVTVGQGSIAIGVGASVSSGSSIAIGTSASATGSNQFVVGGGSSGVSSGYFGNGVTAALPQSFTLNATGGAGTDIAGGNLALAAGRATGNAAGGSLLFQTSTPSAAAGTSLRGLSTVLTLQGSSGAATFQNAADSTVGLQVQRLNADVVFAADTLNNRLKVGNSTGTGTATALLVLDSAAGVNPTGVAGAMFYDSTNNRFMCFTTTWVNCDTTGGGGSITNVMKLIPEFAGGIITADGTNNTGSILADYDSATRHSYYEWLTTQGTAQDYDVIARTQLPSNFASGMGTDSNYKFWIYDADGSATNAQVTWTMTNASGTQCFSGTFNATATSTWEQKTASGLGMNSCTFAANDIITFRFRLQTTSGAGAIRIGEVDWQYTN